MRTQLICVIIVHLIALVGLLRGESPQPAGGGTRPNPPAPRSGELR